MGFISLLRFFGLKKSLNSFDKNIVKLESKIGIGLQNSVFAKEALSHRSYQIEENEKSNERLEFLGDSVLGLIVGEYLFNNYPSEDEGFLTITRSHIVDKNALAEAAEKLELESFILYNKKFIKNSGEGIKTIVADALEALIGAIYLEKGFETAERFVQEWIIQPAVSSGKYQENKNFKGRLLEFTHANNFSVPQYLIVKEEGPDHDKKFTSEVYLGKECYGSGIGKNKKAAEQEAARQALEKLTELAR